MCNLTNLHESWCFPEDLELTVKNIAKVNGFLDQKRYYIEEAGESI